MSLKILKKKQIPFDTSVMENVTNKPYYAMPMCNGLKNVILECPVKIASDQSRDWMLRCQTTNVCFM